MWSSITVAEAETKLKEFVVELRAEVGDSDQLPSAALADKAVRSAVPSAIFNNSTVRFVTAATKNRNIMRTGPAPRPQVA